MLKLVTQRNEVRAFREQMVSFIARQEVEAKVFTKWLCWFDDNKEDHYVTLNKDSTRQQEVCLPDSDDENP